MVQQLKKQLTNEQVAFFDSLRVRIRGGDEAALKRFLPEAEKHGLLPDLVSDLRVWLKKALEANNRSDMNTIVLMAAAMGEQDLLLEAQSALIPEREIVLEDDSAIMALVAESFEMSKELPGARGIRDAGPVPYIGKKGERARPWDGMGLLPDETDEDEGPSQESFGKGTRSVRAEYDKWAGPRQDDESEG